MKTTEMRLYDDKICGVKVSKYGLEKGYLDYSALAKILGNCILNNTVRAETMEDWEIVTGDLEGEIFQDYIISEYGYEFLAEHTDEIVFYNEKLDIHVWGVTHFGTTWDYVLTDIKLVRSIMRPLLDILTNEKSIVHDLELICMQIDAVNRKIARDETVDLADMTALLEELYETHEEKSKELSKIRGEITDYILNVLGEEV